MPATALLEAELTAAAPLDRCRHCGDVNDGGAVTNACGTFCCTGCATVFEILDAHGLCEVGPSRDPFGVSQRDASRRDPERFAVLDDPAVAARFIDFDDGVRTHVTLTIPSIHCASCVWVLEQLWRFEPGVARSEVDLMRRSIHIEFQAPATSLRAIAERLAALGYEPQTGPERAAVGMPASRQRLYLQLGVAGFAFGNIMIFSLPRYLNGGPIDGGFDRLFGWIDIGLALPVLLFSASDYFRASWQAARRRQVTLNLPVAIGLAVLYARSVFEIANGRGEGFLDSFSGLVFFLLIGKLFQQQAFDAIAFDRTFRSFFPLSVRADRGGRVERLPLEQLRTGDTIHLRPGEIVPADALVLDADGEIDYAFLTGEQAPVVAHRGDTVRAGGRVAGRSLDLRVLREVSHSQLARLWNNPVFGKAKTGVLTAVSAQFGAWFLVITVALAAAGALVWWPDVAMSANVATAVLIIACPCALTLAAPITLGTAMGMLGRSGLYLKQAGVVLDLSHIDTVIFDKTGTLTGTDGRLIVEQEGLLAGDWERVRRLAAESVHPASRAIAASGAASGRIAQVSEIPGQGLTGLVDGERIAIGTASFVAGQIGMPMELGAGRTFVGIAPERRGWFRLIAPPRAGVEAAAQALSATHDVFLTSGDHAGDAERWRPVFGARMTFHQSPEDKLALVQRAQLTGRRVAMIGDGLNDAGALSAANVGIAVSDDTACVVPSCDAVVAGARLAHLPAFVRYARRARGVIRFCFVLSIAYNALGLTFALSGRLTPLVSAILMPVSSLVIIGLSTGAMRWSARRMLPS